MTPYWPAALRLDQAAAYCGLSAEMFKEKCPVKPINFTESTRGNRWLRSSLDNWLASLEPKGQPSPTGRRPWGERLGGRSEAQGA